MPYTIPIQVYEQLEAKLGKESAHIISESLEKSINATIEESKEHLKIVVSEELKKELVTKHDLVVTKMELEKQIMEVEKKIEKQIAEVDKKIIQVESRIDLVQKDMRLMELRIIAIVVLLFVLSNPNILDFLSRLFGIIK